MRTGSGGKGREGGRRHYLCRQVHIGYEADCLWLSCENRARNLCLCVSEEREDREQGEREGEDTQGLSLSSGTHRIHNSLTEKAVRLPVVEFRELLC